MARRWVPCDRPNILTVKSMVETAFPNGSAALSESIIAISPSAPTELAAKAPAGASNAGVSGASNVTEPFVAAMTRTPNAAENGMLPNIAVMRLLRFGSDATVSVNLQIHQQTTWILKRFFHPYKEGHGPFAVYDTVIVGQRQIHHWADHNFTLDRHWAVLNFVHA